ncbi:hypothetical protein TNCV_614771 [Trichonephila clavipes]|nr:hypothetical protein TNCV_614771 [Trichonephila clavipes]
MHARHGLADMFENTRRFKDCSSSFRYSCQQVHFKVGWRVFNPGSERSIFRQVLMHPSKRLMIRLLSRWISFAIQPNSNTSISIGKIVDEEEIHQLGVRITIHVHRTLSMSEMKKPHVPTLQTHVQRHLSLSAHAFLCNYVSSRCPLPPSDFVHGIRGHPV